MTDLSCKYLGLQLKNPLIVGSSGVFYKKHFDILPQIISGLETWMEEHKFKRISDFKGLLSRKNVHNPAVYERVQFLRLFSSIE